MRWIRVGFEAFFYCIQQKEDVFSSPINRPAAKFSRKPKRTASLRIETQGNSWGTVVHNVVEMQSFDFIINTSSVDVARIPIGKIKYQDIRVRNLFKGTRYHIRITIFILHIVISK